MFKINYLSRMNTNGFMNHERQMETNFKNICFARAIKPLGRTFLVQSFVHYSSTTTSNNKTFFKKISSNLKTKTSELLEDRTYSFWNKIW